MSMQIYPFTPVAVKVRAPAVETLLALARAERANLKVLTSLCRKEERNRRSSDRDRECVKRLRHSISGMLAISRVGGRS